MRPLTTTARGFVTRPSTRPRMCSGSVGAASPHRGPRDGAARRPDGAPLGRRGGSAGQRSGRATAVRTSAVVVDFGTATTFDCVATDGAYVGGAIAPGLELGLEALAARTAKLPRIELRTPDRAIGRNTVSAMQSGTIFGYQALTSGLLDRIRERENHETPDRPPARRCAGASPRGFDDEPVLVETFALVREMARRTLGTPHYSEQLMGGLVLARGMLAEMDTGEGKTLTATLPACAAALAGVPVHVMSANDYLVERDAEAMGPLYRALGLSVGTVTEGDPGSRSAARGLRVRRHVRNREGDRLRLPARSTRRADGSAGSSRSGSIAWRGAQGRMTVHCCAGCVSRSSTRPTAF